jgi:hypothetical protein
VRCLGEHAYDLSRNLKLDGLRMDRVVIDLSVHQLEAKAAVGARMPDLIPYLWPNERVRRRAPRIESGTFDVTDIACHSVALQRNHVALDYRKPNLICLPFR